MLSFVRAESDGHTLDALIDEFARVFNEPGTAREVARRAGFPMGEMPAFDKPLVFWSRVVREVSDGKITGGVSALVEQAAKRFPGNQIFAARGIGTATATTPTDLRSIRTIDPEIARSSWPTISATHPKKDGQNHRTAAVLAETNPHAGPGDQFAEHPGSTEQRKSSEEGKTSEGARAIRFLSQCISIASTIDRKSGEYIGSLQNRSKVVIRLAAVVTVALIGGGVLAIVGAAFFVGMYSNFNSEIGRKIEGLDSEQMESVLREHFESQPQYDPLGWWPIMTTVLVVFVIICASWAIAYVRRDDFEFSDAAWTLVIGAGAAFIIFLAWFNLHGLEYSDNTLWILVAEMLLSSVVIAVHHGLKDSN